MSRHRTEFTGATKRKALERSGGKCESCGAVLQPGKVEYDHQVPCGLGGDNSLGNCACVCKACHAAKTARQDVPRIAKAKRVHAKHMGATASRNPLPGGKNSPWKKKIDGTVEKRE